MVLCNLHIKGGFEISFTAENDFIGWHAIHGHGMCTAVFTMKTFQQITIEKTLIVTATNQISIPCPTDAMHLSRRRSSNIYFTDFWTNWLATGCCRVWNWFSRTVGAPASRTAHTLYRSICTIWSTSGYKFFMRGRTMCYRIRTSFQTLRIRIICW